MEDDDCDKDSNVNASLCESGASSKRDLPENHCEEEENQ